MDAKEKLAPYWKVMKLVWPLALGMANNALMQFTDRVFLARESTASLEAVLPASILAILFISFFQSVVAYSGTFVAQYHGAGDPDGCARSCRAGLLLSLIGGLILTLFIPLGWLVCDWSGHSPAVLAREKTYYTIVMSGSFFICAAMASTIFLGGWAPLHIYGLEGFNHVMDYIPGAVWMVGKTFFVVFLLMWIRWTFPRLRIDQLLALEWKYLMPMSLVLLVLMAICVSLGLTL